LKLCKNLIEIVEKETLENSINNQQIKREKERGAWRNE
jgi:hypothetical protein